MILNPSKTTLLPWVKFTIPFLYFLISIACGFYYCSLPPSPDQSIFDYIGWQSLQGIRWYSGSFDVTWPGSLLIHEYGIWLFGVHRWTARLTDFVLLQPAVLAMYFFLARSGLKWAALGAALTYPIIYVTSGVWMAGHRDIVAMHMLIGAACVALSMISSGRIRIGALFLSGLLIGYAVMVRPTYLTFAPLLAVICFISFENQSLRRFLILATAIGAGVLAPAALFLLAGLALGNLGDWYQESVRFVLDVYPAHVSFSELASRFYIALREQIWWLVLAAAIGAPFFASSRQLRLRLALLAAMVITVVISFFVQGKGFAYHMGGLIPVFVLIAFGGVEAAMTCQTKARMSYGMAVGLLALLSIGVERRIHHSIIPYVESGLRDRKSFLLVSTDFQQELVRSESVAIVRSESCPNDFFFEWGWNYDVGYLSQRKFATRFTNTTLLPLIEKTDPRYAPWLDQFELELRSHAPQFVLIDLTTLPKDASVLDQQITFRSEPRAALKILMDVLAESYVVRRQWPDRILYKRRDQINNCQMVERNPKPV